MIDTNVKVMETKYNSFNYGQNVELLSCFCSFEVESICNLIEICFSSVIGS